jgi:predicted ATPase/DNA-binding winged helix-turn-helix (wHTH) protein
MNSGAEVRLGTRGFDLLLLLVERAGDLVTKEELIARAWPNTIVEEINLRVNIATLRRKLGDGQGSHRYIVNEVGRGYSFVAPVSVSQSSQPPESRAEIRRPHTLPAPLTRMVGRDHEERLVTAQLEKRRLVTIVGVGGVGKSTLGLAAANRSIASFSHGAAFVDLSSISSSESLSTAFATAVGVSAQAENTIPSLLAFLRDKQMLLVVDNCEHVVSAVGSLLDSLLQGATQLHVLATSREPLGRPGEWVYRLAPLGTPEERVELSADQLERYPALALFIERASTGQNSLQLTPSNAAAIARICRRLDGIPLAIELATARIDSLGLEELAARLEDQSFMMSSGRSTGAARHQTLRATLDWSYALLSPSEQLTLRRLAIFRGPFTLETAVGVVARDGLTEQTAVLAVLGLADKSMLTTEVSEANVRHRQLLTTQAYAYEKLRITNDTVDIFRWHAEQIGRLLRQAESDWNSMTRSTWVCAYAYAIEDVRAAIEWAFSPFGDVLLGATLTLEALPFGFQWALTEEFLIRTEHALARLSELPAEEPVLESRLKAGLAALMAQLELTPEADQSATANPHASMQNGITKYQIGPLMTKAIIKIEAGDYNAVLKTAQQLNAVARNSADPLAKLMSHRLLAHTQHFAELLRPQAEALFRGTAGHQSKGEALLLQAIAIADAQEALAWKLRAAMSLVRLRRSQNRPGEARALLARVYSQFSEGFGTVDLQAARSLMRAL